VALIKVAVRCAAEATGSAVAERVGEWQDLLDIWEIQRKLYEALRDGSGVDPALLDELLRSPRLDATALYNRFAAPHAQFELCLHLLGTCNVDDGSEIRGCWWQLLAMEGRGDAELGRAWRRSTAQRVVAVASPLLQSFPFTVPLRWLCSELESMAARALDAHERDFDADWLAAPLLELVDEGHLRFASLLDAYAGLLPTSHVLPELRAHQLRAVATLASLWLDHRKASLASRDDLSTAQEFEAVLQQVRRDVDQTQVPGLWAEARREALEGAEHALGRLRLAAEQFRDPTGLSYGV